MRAKTVKENMRKCEVFDFDDTLVKTDAKVHIYRDGRKARSITPTEFNTYKKAPGETYDMSDFKDPRIILNARKYKMWPALENINSARKMGRSNSDIFILTARTSEAQLPIHNLLTRNGIDIPLEHIITIGNESIDDEFDIAAAKEKELRRLKEIYSNIMFYDDSEENIELASRVGGIKTRLIDWNK